MTHTRIHISNRKEILEFGYIRRANEYGILATLLQAYKAIFKMVNETRKSS